jgi:hypothetical protein
VLNRCVAVIALLLASSPWGRSQAVPPTPVRLTSFFNLTASQSIDNRSITTRHNNIHLIHATGSGVWSVTLQFSDVSASGPWTNFSDPAATVTSFSPTSNGGGFGYHDYIRVFILGTATVAYSGTQNLYIPFAFASSLISSINGDTTQAQTINSTSDTNLVLTVVDNGVGVHSLQMSWLGTLADARIASAATWNAKQPAGNYITGLTGDISANGPGSVPSTLATVNGSPGACGSATQECLVTTDSKGRVISQSQTTITPAESSVTFTDVTTNNVSPTKHGYVPKIPNDPNKCFLGDGTYGACGVGASSLWSALLAPTSDLTLNFASHATTFNSAGLFTYHGQFSADVLSSSDNTHSGIVELNGLTSGEVAFAVADVAGTAIAYILPSTNGVADQVLFDSGVTTCPTLPTGSPSTCHLLKWVSVPTCVDTGGKHLNYDTSTHVFSCGTSSSGIRGIPFSIGDPAGSTLTVASTTTDYITVPFACTISAYNLLIDAGTITVKFWKVATGTAIPTSTNSINTSGVGISSGTAIHSTTLTDFTTTAVAANDIMAVNITAVTTAKYFSAVLECDQ